MRILVDTHTHTNCSAHAFGTLKENMESARDKGLEMVVMTNHGPDLPDSPHIWHFQSMYDLPREINGVKLMCGIECSIVDTHGNIDLPFNDLSLFDVVIASLHQPVYSPKSKDEHTQTYMNVIENSNVDIIGHCGSYQFDFDHEPVIRLAKEYDKCIEINNHSFIARKLSIENCVSIAKLCKKNGTKIVVSSDAHSPWEVGRFDEALKMLTDIDFPEELVMNTTADKFIKYMNTRRR